MIHRQKNRFYYAISTSCGRAPSSELTPPFSRRTVIILNYLTNYHASFRPMHKRIYKYYPFA